MNKAELEKLAFDYPNDFDLGGIIRQIIPTLEEESTQEENTEDETSKSEFSEGVNWKNAYARLAADFDNYRKRVAKEREDLVTRTKTAMLEPIMDMDSDVSLAFEAIKDEQSKHGLKLIIAKLNKFLATHGIETIPTDSYDPDKHEVISVMNEGATDIGAVISKGYSFGDKIIRFPKVMLK
jgi:molecular chaperone GrpE